MRGNLLEPDAELSALDVREFMEIISNTRAGILRKGRALMELGRRASLDNELLDTVVTFADDPVNRQSVIMGTFTVSQAGAAGS